METAEKQAGVNHKQTVLVTLQKQWLHKSQATKCDSSEGFLAQFKI
jgi:hypothetical protein